MPPRSIRQYGTVEPNRMTRDRTAVGDPSKGIARSPSHKAARPLAFSLSVHPMGIYEVERQQVHPDLAHTRTELPGHATHPTRRP